jgi:hypothetical protein
MDALADKMKKVKRWQYLNRVVVENHLNPDQGESGGEKLKT